MQASTVQIPVLKAGSLKKAQWSTRVLTIDVATATLTISRHNHPNNILYHTLRVDAVQMWPRFAQSCIADDWNALESKLTLRIVGDAVPVPNFSVPTSFVSVEDVHPPQIPLTSARGSPAATSSPPPPTFSLTMSDGTKQSREQRSGMHWWEDAWMIRFTNFESYELAIGLLMVMRNKESVELRAVCPYVASDLAKIEKAWISQQRSFAGLADVTVDVQ